MGRSRGGLMTKVHALVDAEGRPIRILSRRDRLMTVPQPKVVGQPDAGRNPAGRRGLRLQRHSPAGQAQDVWANIPPKSNRKGTFVFSAFLYRCRNLVERF